ncbi:unnamed protein product [Vitrella brassicaformis CCMP3155]|uniref:Uncharacterized protein n=1 Tax=Vitrella brassicaformis (strain CCMP3155) TaxID=1169540 RepID=A0A0G4F8N2_VITBC|nr:unnamed protein product [Vitrella brassicaformis CCMP3155]|eukprot:CEM08918.1 unnamed protein product [Vitrella brassicaformis CCMP3155]
MVRSFVNLSGSMSSESESSQHDDENESSFNDTESEGNSESSGEESNSSSEASGESSASSESGDDDDDDSSSPTEARPEIKKPVSRRSDAILSDLRSCLPHGARGGLGIYPRRDTSGKPKAYRLALPGWSTFSRSYLQPIRQLAKQQGVKTFSIQWISAKNTLVCKYPLEKVPYKDVERGTKGIQKCLRCVIAKRVNLMEPDNRLKGWQAALEGPQVHFDPTIDYKALYEAQRNKDKAAGQENASAASGLDPTGVVRALRRVRDPTGNKNSSNFGIGGQKNSKDPRFLVKMGENPRKTFSIRVHGRKTALIMAVNERNRQAAENGALSPIVGYEGVADSFERGEIGVAMAADGTGSVAPSAKSDAIESSNLADSKQLREAGRPVLDMMMEESSSDSDSDDDRALYEAQRNKDKAAGQENASAASGLDPTGVVRALRRVRDPTGNKNSSNFGIGGQKNSKDPRFLVKMGENPRKTFSIRVHGRKTALIMAVNERNRQAAENGALSPIVGYEGVADSFERGEIGVAMAADGPASVAPSAKSDAIESSNLADSKQLPERREGGRPVLDMMREESSSDSDSDDDRVIPMRRGREGARGLWGGSRLADHDIVEAVRKVRGMEKVALRLHKGEVSAGQLLETLQDGSQALSRLNNLISTQQLRIGHVIDVCAAIRGVQGDPLLASYREDEKCRKLIELQSPDMLYDGLSEDPKLHPLATSLKEERVSGVGLVRLIRLCNRVLEKEEERFLESLMMSQPDGLRLRVFQWHVRLILLALTKHGILESAK